MDVGGDCFDNKDKTIATIIRLASFPIHGWIMTMLWGWFIVPFGVQQIGIAHAIGLKMICSYLTHFADVKDDEREIESAMKQIYFGLFVFLIGWIASFFM